MVRRKKRERPGGGQVEGKRIIYKVGVTQSKDFRVVKVTERLAVNCQGWGLSLTANSSG